MDFPRRELDDVDAGIGVRGGVQEDLGQVEDRNRMGIATWEVVVQQVRCRGIWGQGIRAPASLHRWSRGFLGIG